MDARQERERPLPGALSWWAALESQDGPWDASRSFGRMLDATPAPASPRGDLV
jgi:hypothetical protein